MKYQELKENIKIRIYLFLQKISNQLQPQNEASQDKYEDLTPKDDLEKDEYIDALEWALQNHKIQNIALTGSFGSGKSSILRSFERLNPNNTYLRISLASFSDPGDKQIPQEKKKEAAESISDEIDNITKGDPIPHANTPGFNRLLERSILQQIFYKAIPQKIKQSRFRRIHKTNKRKVFIYAVLIFVWLIAITATLNKELLINLTHWSLFKSTYLKFIYLPIVLLGTLTILYNLLILIKNLGFSKMNLVKGEIELAKNIDASILNKYFDEILYFFEETETNIVIIEDLDRFSNTDIFTKLRELNLLLNNAEQLRIKPVVFIYAIKDHLFNDQSRTKFFDFIIPIIPIVDSHNSKQKLTDRLSDKVISKEILSATSLYINDMRLLKNIVNEYKIYHSKLRTISNLDQDKLFATVVLKNKAPKIFEQLHYQKGIIFDCFHKNKETLIKLKRSELKEAINKVKDKISESDNENIHTIADLRRRYIFEIFTQLPLNSTHVQLNNQKYGQIELIEDEAFEKLMNVKDFNYIKAGYSGDFNSGISFSDIENDVNPNYSYSQRVQMINNQKAPERQSLENKLNTLKNQYNNLKVSNLHEIINGMTNPEISKALEIQDNLLIYLISEGFIDENYYNYMSYFHPGSLTSKDQEFLLAIYENKRLDYSFKITNKNEILERISSKHFNQTGVLNNELVDHLLSDIDLFNEEISKLIDQFTRNEEPTRRFIDQYLKIKDNRKGVLIKLIIEKWVNFWKTVEQKRYPSHEINDILNLIFENAEESALKRFDQWNDGRLSNYISRMEDFLSFSNKIKTEQVCSILGELNINFSHLEFNEHNDVLNFIYHHNLYELNQHMTVNMLSIYGVLDSEMSSTELVQYSSIKNSKADKLIEYVDSKIELYARNILLSVKDKVVEKEFFFIKLLNNEKISDDTKAKLIQRIDSKITDIDALDHTTHWSELLDYSRIEATWSNINNYLYQFDEFDENIVGFINKKQHYEALKDQELEDSNEHEVLISKLLLCNSITDEAYSSIVNSIDKKFNSLPSIEDIDFNKAEILIEQGVLETSSENFQSLKEHHPPLHIRLIHVTPFNFYYYYENYKVDESDLELIFKSLIMNYYKVKIINKIRLAELEINKKLAHELNKILIANNDTNNPDFDTLKVLHKNAKSNEEQVRLINRFDNILSNTNLTELLQQMDRDYADLTKKGPRPKFINSDFHKIIAESLKDRKMISSVKNEGDYIRINTKKK